MTRAQSDTVKSWAWIAVPVIGTVLTTAFFLLPAGSTEQSAVYDAVGLGAVGAAVIGLRLYRPTGWQPWVLMALGQLAFAAGDALWTIYRARGENPFPSLADVLYLLGYVFMAAGLSVAIRRRITGGDRTGLLDAAILTTGAAVVWWAFVLGPLAAAAADPNPLAFAISVAYPIGDLVLIGMVLGLVMTPGARSPSFAFLGVSLLTLLVADLIFGLQNLAGTYVDGAPLDGLWILAYIAFAMAAMHPTMRLVFEPRPIAVTLLGPIRLLLLAAAMLVGPILLTVGRDKADTIVHVVAGATALLSVLVLARLATLVRLLARDIERRAALEEQLSFQAFHDPLTGLANRRRFMAAVADELASDRATAALFLDLDDFKNVNDNMGHDAGDALLLAIGNRLVASLRPTDLAARLGGDEFAVLLRTTESAAEAQAVGIRLLAAISAPVVIEGVALQTSASVGVALRASDEPMNGDELLRRADVAMYHAKARGKRRCATYTPEFDEQGDNGTPSARAVVRRSAPAV